VCLSSGVDLFPPFGPVAGQGGIIGRCRAFDHDVPDDAGRLPEEHRKLFVQAVHELLRPALDAGAHTGAVPWPRALRVHRIGVSYSMTWSFAGPNGRALFRLAEVAGETVVVWLRVGNHGLYDS
jgi:hypothetical protein